MIRAVSALLRKELQQQFATFMWLVFFCAVITWLLFRVSIAGGQILSYLSITSSFAVPAFVIIAFIVGQRLVAAEYFGQTQRFIEALPVQQSYAHWVKFVFGYISLFLLLGGIWVACVIVASRFETISQEFTALMVIRICAFIFAVWSTIFTFSLLGRLRIPLIAAVAFAISLINTYTQFELDRFGPLALMNDQLFAFERTNLPVNDLIETLVSGAIMLSLGMWLANMRDGSFVESLATPVTSRAKGFLIALSVTTLGIYSYFGPEPEAAPFAFSDDYLTTDGLVQVSYLDPRFEPDAIQLLDYLSERTEALFTTMPSFNEGFFVRVSLAPAADATEFHTQLADPEEGVLVSANFEKSAQWNNEFFGAYIFHEIISAKSNGRALLEPRHWLLDGFGRWWGAKSEQLDQTQDAQFDPIMLEALYATRDLPITKTALRQWDLSVEHFGENLGLSVAYSGWKILQEQKGSDIALRLAQQEFSRPTYTDARDWWNDWRDPPPERFARATGWEWSDFVETWERRMNELRAAPPYRDRLDNIAKGRVNITPEVSDQGRRSIRYSLELSQPLPQQSKCVALHTKMPSVEYPIGRSGLREAEIYWPASTAQEPALSIEYVLSGEYGAGTRVYAAFECQIPEFPAPLYLGSARLTMP